MENNEGPSERRLVDDSFSEKKSCCVVLLTQSNLAPGYNMVFPPEMLPDVPIPSTIPAIISCRGKIWETYFIATREKKELGFSWKPLAMENKLEIGNALAWEVLEIKKHHIKFNLQIIEDAIPSNKSGATVDPESSSAST